MFISFEGMDGSGKTTQVEMVYEYLSKEGRNVVKTKEPYSKDFHELKKLFNKTNETALYLLDRNKHVKEVISPSLRNGDIVLCDRYRHSTMAYQKHFIQPFQPFFNSTVDELPDLTIWYDVSPKVAYERIMKRGGEDIEYGDFMKQYLQVNFEYSVMSMSKMNIIRVDADLDQESVFEQTIDIINKRMK